MWSLVVAVASAFGVVFIAELGDKTQLLALGYGARHGLRTVALGLTLGYAAAGAIAALVGGLLGATLPERPVGLAAGALFLVFAVLAWRDLDHDDEESGGEDDGQPTRRLGARSVVASIALTIAIAEFGDKTQLATAALAAQANPFATWLGATGGVVTAGMLGAVAGSRIGQRIEPRKIQIASAVLFAGFGVALIAAAW
ncbi:MAG: TMEM165/GDT1 family protein [Ilumatobacteraceae bacterium]|nr:TMEM165/GDT1 family protein [Ilumatobacteraceae bacterium]